VGSYHSPDVATDAHFLPVCGQCTCSGLRRCLVRSVHIPSVTANQSDRMQVKLPVRDDVSAIADRAKADLRVTHPSGSGVNAIVGEDIPSVAVSKSHRMQVGSPAPDEVSSIADRENADLRATRPSSSGLNFVVRERTFPQSRYRAEQIPSHAQCEMKFVRSGKSHWG
jgi:hypothetical protein